ncbi:nucleolin 2-like isoform X2 [Lotus japonicus]|uniref:nucleolin 2-like isoform X2 n=1 Tax=Lotus japonicus TaxID=34305 RepID=UPI0025883E6F|nr:nucleolin 2-like isoform X2 [Lotus japonicus]
MATKSDPKVCVLLKEGEDEDQEAKKQKRNEAAEEEQKNKQGGMDIDDGACSEDSDEEAQKEKMEVLADASALPPPKNGKREGDDEKQANTKKQRTGEVIEEQKNKEKINTHYSEKDKKPESKKREPATSCRSLESTDDGSSESSFDRSSYEDNHVNDSKSTDDDEEEIEEKASETTQECPKTPTTMKGKDAPKTIYVRNLSYSVERADLESLFKDCGEVVDVHLHTDSEGRFKAFGHVEFATPAAAQKALELDNTELLRCPIKVSIAMGEYAPSRRLFNNGDKFQSQAALLKGFDTSLVAEKPKTPTIPEKKNSASKTIYVSNLSYDVEHADMEYLFKDCGEIVDIRLHKDRNGRFRGFGHVEFATSEAAQNALELDYREMCRRRIKVGLALEKGEYACNKSAFHMGQRFQPQTAFLKDSDKSHVEDKPENSGNPRDESSASKTIYVRNLTYRVERTDLENLFKDCGEIVDVRLCEGRFKGLGHVEFATAEAAHKALELDNAELCRRTIRVGIAREKVEYVPNRSNLSSSVQTSERFQPLTAFFKGCGTSVVEHQPETLANPREKNAASKTIYVTNLTYGVERADMENLFKDCGDIVDVRLHKAYQGGFKDFAHVEFSTSEAAQKALELDNTELLRRPIKVCIAEEKGEYAPNRRNLSCPFDKDARFQPQSALIKGCRTSLLEDKLETPGNPKVENAASKTIFIGNLSYSVERADVENLFKGCGEIVDVRLYRNHEGRLKGFGHVDFLTEEAALKALKLHKTEMLKRPIVVEIAQKKDEYILYRRNLSNSVQKSEGILSLTVFENCFDTSLAEEKPVKDSKNFEDREEETERNASNTPLKSPKSSATLKQKFAASKTIYVKNIPYHVERADVENHFKDCGEVVDVRLHTDREGRSIGSGHIEFATAEASQKALQLDNTELLKRRIKIDIAHEKGEYTSDRRSFSNLSSLFHKDERSRSQTVFVKGFDTSIAQEMLKASLEEHFSSCGEITSISVPKFWDSGVLKGFAYLDFKDVDGFKKALQLDQTELGGYPLLVEKAKPRLHNQGTYSARGDGGYHFGGRDGGGHDSGVGWGNSCGGWRR